MSFHELVILISMCLVAPALSIALGDTHSSAAATPTIRTDDKLSETPTPNMASNLGAATAAAATATASNAAMMPTPEPLSTYALASVVPVLAMSITAAAILFRLYSDRREQEQEEAMLRPAELEAGSIPIELEAKEDSYYGRYSQQ